MLAEIKFFQGFKFAVLSQYNQRIIAPAQRSLKSKYAHHTMYLVQAS
jgi:hypothetical protein